MTESDTFDGPEILGDSVPYLAHRVGNLMERLFEPSLKSADLTMDMWRVLFILDSVGEHNLVDLARVTTVKTSTLSRLIGRMERRGLISKTRSDRDNRAVDVTILDPGREIVERLTPRVNEVRDLVSDGFGPDELRILKTYMRRLYRTLRAFERQADGR